MKRLLGLLLVVALGSLSCYCVTVLFQLHDKKQAEALSHFAKLPEPIAQAITLEFQGAASDYLMLKVLTYLGQKIMEDEQPTNDEWQTVHLALRQVTNLDPRFLDPYVVAQMTLPFEAKMVKETNALLEKAAQVLKEDYRPYFFLWYNYLYYLNDPATAGKYLEKSARIPGAPPYFATLAARMNLYAGKIYAAVIFLEETLKETTDPSFRKFLSMRIDAFKKIGFLEMKILEFRKRFHKMPKTLQELIDRKIITRIPEDPFGGKFYILEGGRVYTTSELVSTKRNSN